MLNIFTLIIGLITASLIWVYSKRASLDYNSGGKFFSTEDGVVYNESAKEIFGISAFLGLVLTVLLIIRFIKRKY